MDNKAVSLYDLLGQVKLAFKSSLPGAWWVMAEISEMKLNYSGHCYLELIEKNESGESIRAKVRATIWSSVFRMLQPYFETTTRMQLTAGIKVMVKVNVDFHELYGFSLNITDIEPSYTIGELARQKQEIINRLKAEGVFDMNKQLTVPRLPCKIAVISSGTAAGFGDFTDQLKKNQFGYKFYLKLFPAVMQGDEAEQSIIAALDKIYRYEAFFDAVVIIRGGGAQSDLNCFNSYWLNYNICQFPLPVLTGIGHEQDETIADLVACKRLKTPTAVAEFLISLFQEADEEISERSLSLYNMVNDRVRDENERLNQIVLQLKPAIRAKMTSSSGKLREAGLNLKSLTRHVITAEKGKLESRLVHLRTALKEYLNNKLHQTEILEKRTGYLNPFNILKRGYSITYFNGRALKSPAEVKSEEVIETKLAGGVLKSKII